MSTSSDDSGESLPGTGETIIIKIGSSSLVDSDKGVIRLLMLSQIVDVVQRVQELGYRVVLVSSGAVNMGCVEMGLKLPPPREQRIQRQAFAAVGMSRLMRVYESLFSTVKQPIAQILLTRADMKAKMAFNNLLHTIERLHAMGVLPIVNENDTVTTDGHEFGDNDALAAMIAGLKSAKWLFLLTDVDGLYNSNPVTNPDAKMIHVVDDIFTLGVDTSSSGTAWGTGGMKTKLSAARLAQTFGSTCVISNAKYPERIVDIIHGVENVGTKFLPHTEGMKFDKKRILFCLEPVGTIVIDDNAELAIRGMGTGVYSGKKSLYAAGVTEIDGMWPRGGAVRVVSQSSNKEIARAVCYYSSSEIDILKGEHSSNFERLLANRWRDDDPQFIVHRDQLALWD